MISSLRQSDLTDCYNTTEVKTYPDKSLLQLYCNNQSDQTDEA